MAETKQFTNVNLGGLDAGGKNPQLVRNGLLVLENGQYLRQNAISLRNGFQLQTSTYTDDRLASYKDKPVIVGDQVRLFNGNPDSGSSATGTFDLSSPYASNYLGCAPSNVLIENHESTAPVSSVTQHFIYFPEVVTFGSVTAYCWLEQVAAGTTVTGTFRVQLRVISRYSKALLSTKTCDTITGIHNAKLVQCSSGIYFLYIDSSANVRILSVNTTSGAQESDTDLTTATWVNISAAGAGNNGETRFIDACDIGSSTIMCVYQNTGDAALSVNTVAAGNFATRSTSTVITLNAAGPCVFSVFKWATGTGMVLYYDSSAAAPALYAEGFNSSCAVSINNGGAALPTHSPLSVWAKAANMHPAICCGVISSVASTGRVFWQLADTSAAAFSWAIKSNSLVESPAGTIAVGAADGVYFLNTAIIHSKPFVIGSNVNLVVSYKDESGASARTDNPSYYLVRDRGVDSSDYTMGGGSTFAQNVISGSILHGKAGVSVNSHTYVNAGAEPVASNVTSMSLGGITYFETGGSELIVNAADASSGFLEGTFAHILIDAAPTTSKCIEANDGLLIPGSLPMIYDGRIVFEQGFAHAPNRLSATTSNSTGTLTAGDYAISAVYEWIDSQGKRWQSEPADSVTSTIAGANDTITLTVPCLHLTKRDNVKIVVYMSDAVNSSILRRKAVLANSQSTQKVSLTIESVASSTQEALYTIGGELAAELPNGYKTSAVFQDRVFYAPSEEKANRVYYSKTFVPGLPVEYNGLLYKNVPADGGTIVALQSMDDKLIIFKESAIYALYGKGPDATGNNDGYADPYLVSNGAGCSNVDSVVLCPLGVMFLGPDGIYLISRQLQLKPIGDRVRYWTDSQTVTSSLLQQSTNHVVFTCSSGNALVYNYLYDEWATWNNLACQSAVVSFGGVIWLKKSTDVIWSETPGTYVDPSSTLITFRLQTGWYDFDTADRNGIVNHLKNKRLICARMLGYAKQANSQLNFKWAFDYDPTWGTANTYDLDTLGQFFSFSDYYNTSGLTLATYTNKSLLMNIRSPNSRCTSARLSIDNSSSATGDSFEISSLVFEHHIRSDDGATTGSDRST